MQVKDIPLVVSGKKVPNLLSIDFKFQHYPQNLIPQCHQYDYHQRGYYGPRGVQLFLVQAQLWPKPDFLRQLNSTY